jgi:CRISPR/Cas system-associated exonuclease Cas4 (RecB family)
MPENPLFKLSPSSLNLFLECPRCFWLQLVKKEKRPEGIFPSLPGGMDKILKVHFDKFMEKSELPPEIKEHGLANGYKLFDDKAKLDIWRSNFKGIQYKDKTSGILLRGAVDNLLQKGKKLIVLDYKTRGYPLKKDTHEHYITQMDIYNFLLRKNGYDTADYTYLLFYYPREVTDTGEVVFDTKLIKIKTDPKRGEKIFKKAIKLLQSGDPPEADKECKYCKLREYK